MGLGYEQARALDAWAGLLESVEGEGFCESYTARRNVLGETSM